MVNNNNIHCTLSTLFLRDTTQLQMFCLLFRALCCLCSSRQRSDGNYYYQEDSDYDSSDDDEDDQVEDGRKMRTRALKLSRLKRDAIDATTDVVVAEKLLHRHGGDSSLLMYYDQCSQEMTQALNKLPLGSHGAQIKGLQRLRKGARNTLV